ncbi:hypothetical protein ACGC1H_002289 [Rhizoctonia solani]
MFAQQFFSRCNGSLLYLRSPALGHRPLQKIVFLVHHEVSFPWAEHSPRTADSPCAWFEVARYHRSGRRDSISPPKLRFATAHPVSSEWEEIPNTREILRFEPGKNSTSLDHTNSKLVGGMQPGEKVGVLVIAGRGTTVKHTIREMVIYLFCTCIYYENFQPVCIRLTSLESYACNRSRQESDNANNVPSPTPARPTSSAAHLGISISGL